MKIFDTIWMLFLIFNAIYLLLLFIDKLTNSIVIFVRNFGIITESQLAKLNKGVSLSNEEQFESGADFDSFDVDKWDNNSNNDINNSNNSNGNNSDSGLSGEQYEMSKCTVVIGINYFNLH